MQSFLKCSVVPDGYSRVQHERYSRLRLQVLGGTFLGYSAYYLVRKNFVMVMPDLIDQGYSKTELGMALCALSLSYGISNFIMGTFADRLDVRKLMPLCLILSGCVSLSLGFLPLLQLPLMVMVGLMAVNGCLQGAGWPCSAKLIAHWFVRQERGTAMSLWSLSQNAGCGLLGPLAILAVALFCDWQSLFYFPASIAIVIAISCYFLLRDSPGHCGLPPAHSTQSAETSGIEQGSHSFRQSFRLFGQHCLKLPPIWMLAVVNACIYFVRYGIIDWAPVYLQESKGFSFQTSSWAFFAFEYAAIPGTLICGYLSDKHFRGQRAPVNALFTTLVLISLLCYWQCPAGNTTYAMMSMIATGFLIYGPVMLVHVHIIDLVPLQFAATAAGFIGLFGYLFGATSANLVLGKVLDLFGWDACFELLAAACALALILLLLLWVWENMHPNPNFQFAQPQPATVPITSGKRSGNKKRLYRLFTTHFVRVSAKSEPANH
ncbi:MFS transporter [Endozoicomonas montiporae]|uniref:Glycerol-3-phosphate transporter n=1 Tax=Endozoicomonas montiporae CL-33 TaxID=570277 RepID=A0A142B8B7_9GAMM|nr:MFS transporter [Endozoicomonas montiporae]AMO54993.1 glycerol-3-phosphate transporter [Endozoicomonas montiporae CL-33]